MITARRGSRLLAALALLASPVVMSFGGVLGVVGLGVLLGAFVVLGVVEWRAARRGTP